MQQRARKGERTAVGFFLAPRELDEARTVVDAPRPAEVAVVDGGGERVVFTAEMLEMLRERLRAAEAREASEASVTRAIGG